MTMSKDSRFWRNVTLIALAHVALIVGLIRWSVEARSSSNAQSVVWLGDVGGASAATEPITGEPPRPATPKAFGAPSPEPRAPKSDEAEKQEPLLTAAKSEIELPIPTPTPTSTPKPTATPTPKPKETPKPTPKPTSKKTALAKASPKPSPKVKSSPTKSADKAKKADANAEKKKIAKAASAKNGSSSQNGTGKGSSAGTGGHAGGGINASEFGWYGNMLHDRFYNAWVKPSENVVVNESVAAIAKRVTEVDPPPAGLAHGDHYDVKINFELNTDQQMGN